jgi:allantoinase
VLVVRSTRVVLPEGEHPASIFIAGDVIDRIAGYGSPAPAGAVVFDAANLVVSPGLVDTHVHVNEPGRTEWEGFDTATRAAAAGGVTTIVDMPLNSVPATTNVRALHAKVEAAVAQSHVDVGFWGGVVPGNDAELDGLVDAGVRGFKCFLVPSGIDEFLPVDEAELRRALPVLARRRMPLLVHAELPHLAGGGVRSGECAAAAGGSPRSATLPPQPYATYLATRPPVMEREAIRLVIRLASEFGVATHIVHVSSAEGVEAIAGAKARRVPVTAETCPHYLTFAAEEIPDGATELKCAPPIRSASHRDALWNGLASGALDLVASDHSPSPPAMKTPGDFTRAWGGIPSLELALAAVWTGARARGAAAADLARWLSAAPAALAGLTHRKGRIEAGLDADLVVWDPDTSFVVNPERLQQRHKATPYGGRRLFGVVHTTFVRGGRVWEQQRLARAHGGKLL